MSNGLGHRYGSVVRRAVTRAAFGQRRKMLRQSLKSISPDPAGIIAAAGLDETIRAENVPVEGYVALANAWDAARGFPD